MIKSRIVLAGALLAVAGAANADFSVTPTVTSDYDWRGTSQTGEDPAFQLGINWAHDSGFYLGTWGSNVDFGAGDPNMEIDFFGGFAGGDAAEGFAYDVGVNYYTYMDKGSFNFVELYAGISKGPFSAKVWYSPEFAGDGNDSAFYTEGNVTYPLPSGFSITGHVGYSFGSYWDGGGEYLDYSAGVGYSFRNIDLSAKYVNSNDLPGAGRNAWIFSIATTLPWASE